MTMLMTSDYGQVLKQIAARLGLLVAVLMVTIWGAWRGTSAYQIGSRAVVFDSRAGTFIRAGERIRIIDYGLEAGRGLAYDPNRNKLYVANAWDAIHICMPQRSDDGQVLSCDQEERLPNTNICPDGECETVEHGGLMLDAAGRLLVADRQRRRLLMWDVQKNVRAGTFGNMMLGDVHDAVTVQHGVIVVGQTSEPTAEEREKRISQLGSLYQIAAGNTTPDPIEAKVTRPVGLAYSQRTGRLYVADVEDRRERWRHFTRNAANAWKESGVVWSEPLGASGEWPRLQSMVIAEDQNGSEVIFAAGPDGLYVLDPDGGLLAKYLVGEEVSGVTFGKPGELFMTIGRRISVLRTSSRRAGSPLSFSGPPDQTATVQGDAAPANQTGPLPPERSNQNAVKSAVPPSQDMTSPPASQPSARPRAGRPVNGPRTAQPQNRRPPANAVCPCTEE